MTRHRWESRKPRRGERCKLCGLIRRPGGLRGFTKYRQEHGLYFLSDRVPQCTGQFR